MWYSNSGTLPGLAAEISTVIEQACRRHVAQDNPQLMDDVTEDLTALFKNFLSSEPYKRLQRATVLGREVPFVMPLGKGQIMEGVIDLIYRLDGRIWIADYKTDMCRLKTYRPGRIATDPKRIVIRGPSRVL